MENIFKEIDHVIKHMVLSQDLIQMFLQLLFIYEKAPLKIGLLRTLGQELSNAKMEEI